MTDTSAPARKLRSVSSAPPFAAPRSITALILREMSTTYGRSPGGYIWVMLEPILGIALLSAIFSLGFRTPALGTNFPIFYATGLLPFFMYVNVNTKVAGALQYSRQLLNFPRVSYIDAILARLILTVLTQAAVSSVVLIGILTIFDTRTTLNLPEALLSFTMAATFGAGVGLVNCPLTMRYPVWGSIWVVLNRPLVLMSNVIFLIDRIPRPYHDWLLWNPLVHVTGLSRKAFYYSYDAPYVDVQYVFLVALPLCAMGLILLRRQYRDLLEL